MPLSVLLDMQAMKIVATSSQPKRVLCLSVLADILKVPDDYLILDNTVASLNTSLSFDQKLELYTNMTGHEVKRATMDAVNFMLTKLIDGFEEDTRSADELKKALGRKFVVPKTPIPEGRSSIPKEYRRPAEGTTTGKVWDICDKVFNMQNPPKIPNKDQIVQLCVNAGINPSTAATQYGKWKASK